MAYAKAQPHDPIKTVAEDLYVVYGSQLMNPLMRISRSMTIVRSGSELTLINSVRLDEAGLQALDALGEVKHVLRLGPFHGIDDDFYVDRYSAQFWAYEGGVTYTTPTINQPLTDDGELPIAQAKLFTFSGLKETEGVLLLSRGPGVLLTADAVQSYSTPPHMPQTAWLVKKILPLAGFPNETIIGPMWIKLQSQDREQLKRDFQTLLEWDFDQLQSAHGTFVERGARAELTAAFAKTFA